jgi:uncharacterized membrane protein
MTDASTPQQPPLPPEPPTPSRRGLKIALAVSVALNLGVAGMIAGALINGGGPGRGMPHDLSFGPFSEAFSPDDRRALRQGLMDRASDFRSNSREAKAEFETLLATLRASPFDPAAMQSALAAIEVRTAGRLELGRTLIENRIVEMSDADRLAFAERLEAGLRRKKRD